MKTLYKSIPENKTSNGLFWKLNEWYKITKPLDICKVGFHASKNIIDAMSFVSMGWAAKVEVRGESIIQKDKECWSEMRIVKWKKWTKKDSVSLAIFAAELVLDNFEKKYPDDKRPREAIEAAKAVLKNDNEKTRSAARSAAEAARSAARSAAEAARSAAWSAAEAAWSAAYDKIFTQCHDFVVKRAGLK